MVVLDVVGAEEVVVDVVEVEEVVLGSAALKAALVVVDPDSPPVHDAAASPNTTANAASLDILVSK